MIGIRGPSPQQLSVFVPSFTQLPRWHADRALVAALTEMYLMGVSTRKVEKVAAELGVHTRQELLDLIEQKKGLR